MATERTFELQELIRQLNKEGGYFLGFLKIRDLEAGIILLHPGDNDTQTAHTADELYYIIEGNGIMELGKSKKPIKQGSIVFVPAGLHHRFYGNKEDLIALYMFAE
jgi:mannose-6-phosphate isomerase-like protein (cupin superfamily)